MSNYLYYCRKCNSLVASKYEEEDVKCDDCLEHMSSLHVTEDEWNDMSDMERTSLLEKFRSPLPQVKRIHSVSANAKKEEINNQSRQRINLCELIVQAISIMLLFIPGMFYWEHWEETGFGISTLKLKMSITFFHAADNTAKVLGYVIVALMLLNIAVMLIELFIPSKTPNNKIQIILPASITALFFLFASIAGTRDKYGYGAPVNSLFYVEILLLLSIIVMTLLKIRQKQFR